MDMSMFDIGELNLKIGDKITAKITKSKVSIIRIFPLIFFQNQHQFH